MTIYLLWYDGFVCVCFFVSVTCLCRQSKLFWSHIDYLVLANQNTDQKSSWVSCIDTQGLFVVFRLYKSFPYPHLHSNLQFCSEIIVLRLALINLTNYNSDWVNGLFSGVTNSTTFGGPSKIPGRPPRLSAGVQDRAQVGENPRQIS